jgi:Epoxide hydrolase N terminus
MKKYSTGGKISVKPFKISISREVLDDLHDRLKRTRWPDEVETTGWDYGTNLDYMKELADYWQHSYDWRKQEAELNKLALFTAEIKGTEFHFIHERGKGPNPPPLSFFMVGPTQSIDISSSFRCLPTQRNMAVIKMIHSMLLYRHSLVFRAQRRRASTY